MLSIIIIVYLLINSILSVTRNQLNLNLEYGDNETIILFYNITTNYPYLITFRSFGGDDQSRFGLFSPTNKSEENSIDIPYHNHTTELSYLVIVCFHFILQQNDLDIQCKDIHLLKTNQTRNNTVPDFLPSYNPLFVPMMYALSVIMLLPVIIQHHQRKKAQVVQRRKQIRRLSVTIAQDDQNPQQELAKKMLTQISENGNIIYENVPADTELLSIPSTKSMVDDVNDNNVTFTLQNLQPFTPKYDQHDKDEPMDVNADDCIAHLLDNTPWNSPDTDQPFTGRSSQHLSVRNSATAMKEQYAPTIILFHDDNDDDDDRKPMRAFIKNIRVNMAFLNHALSENIVP